MQVKLVKPLQVPFHLRGGGPNPLSLKLSASGQIPESKTPIMMLLSIVVLSTCFGKPMKSHDLVVCSSFCLLGNTDTTPSIATYSLLQHFVMDCHNLSLCVCVCGGGGEEREREIKFNHLSFFGLLAQLAPLQIHGNSSCSYRVKILVQYDCMQPYSFKKG